MRGQASFILIIGVLLVIAIVIYYAYQGFAPPPVVGEEQRMVQEMIESIITSGTELSLKAIELQGGYVIPPNQSLLFTNIGVPYWQICQNDVSPNFDDVKERFEKGIEFYVNNHTKDIEDFFGENLSLSSVSRVDVNILDNKIDVAVYMPTEFRGYPIRQPYRISVPTKFRYLFNFAKDIVTEINKDPTQGGRFFEVFTVASLYRSRYLPTIGFLTECGEPLRLTPQQVSHGLYGIITYTITHFLWWQEIVPNSLTYAVNDVNGKQYLDLEPMLFLPQGFEIASSSGINIQNRQFIASFPSIPYCYTTYNIKYSVAYPIVIKITDSETGYDFNFAVYVNVDEMEPGDCDAIITIPGQETCTDLPCSASIRVVDCNGIPLSGATAYFGDCLVGTSDSNGYINGEILCGTYLLDIYHSGDYGYYSKTVSSTNIDGTYTLCKKPDFAAYFNEVEILYWGYDEYNTYLSCYPCAEPLDCPDTFTWQSTDCTSSAVSDRCVMITLTSAQTGISYPIHNIDYENIPIEECLDRNYFEAHPVECSGCTLHRVDMDNIPAGTYDVVAELKNPADNKHVGYFELDDFNLLENTKNLYISIPKFGNSTRQPDPWQKQCVVDKVKACPSIELMRQT
ncbi:MAG: hypothetical protein JSW41_05855 [Candidatus Aenigmatarchaeota archaeon]|nr:MAG: hypothetical protein JSW41_05855 [Candidatus Aenigmarchaeota archaeon]